MKNSSIQLASILLFLGQTAFAWFPETEYKAANRFVCHVGVSVASGTNSTNSWNAPEFFVFPNATTNSVVVDKTVMMPSGVKHVLRCSTSNETANASVNVCTNEISALLELCLPCVAFSSMSEEMIARGYSATNHENGVTELCKRNETNRLALLSYGNVSIRFEGEDSRNRALALLRAGGVDIPAEPESPEPNPE